MRTVQINLPTVGHVQRFVGTLAPLSGDFELVTQTIILDARSLMGIFSFDLSKPLTLKIYQDTPENLSAIKPYLADTEAMTHE